MPSVRILVRVLIAVFLTAAPLLAGLVSPAAAQVSNLVSRTDPATSHSLTLSITSVSPDWAKPSSTVTVEGTITNDTGSPIPGIQVGLQTSPVPYQSRSQMESFAGGTGYFSGNQVGTTYTLPRTLHTNVTMNWSASFPVADASYLSFGVYPIEAIAYDTGEWSPLATDRTLLPYWPSGNAANQVSIAWVWPLIDKPQQTACPDTLATNSLSGSFGSGGRLGTLLTAGERAESSATSADLTWVVDPALLSEASEMSSPYQVGGDAQCAGTTAVQADKSAAKWLDALRTKTAGEPMVVTPYADADVSALAQAGLDTDLQQAYTQGESVAQGTLNRPFGKDGNTTGDDGAPALAWPAGGTADASTATALANGPKVSTILLGSSELPGASSDVVTTDTGIGTKMTVLLADSELSGLLGSASADSSQGAQFAVQQDFLAETAMIAAEYPSATGRSVIVAPPPRWDPSAAEADSLLTTTTSVPWLHPESLSTLARGKPDPQELPGNQVSGSELSTGYLSEVKSVDASLALYENLLYQPGSTTLMRLSEALATTESSAWRGPGMGSGLNTLAKLAGFLQAGERQVQLIAGKKILLAGASGDTPVSVRNGLDATVRVGVSATVPADSPLSVEKDASYVTVGPLKTVTVPMRVSSSDIRTSTMQLQLVTEKGWPLPQTQVEISVQATRYGRALLIVIGAALGVLVLTAVARWVRQWLNDTRAGSGGTG